MLQLLMHWKKCTARTHRMIRFLKDYIILIVMFCGFATVISLVVIAGVPAQPSQPSPETPSVEPSYKEVGEESLPQSLEQQALSIRLWDGGKEIPLEVEVAKTPQEQATGLMFRREIPRNTGMLFLFDDEKHRHFWMKNVAVPLDMIFIESNGIIHHIHPMAIPLDETPIASNGKVMAVLELGGGEAENLGINVGDTVIHPAFKASPEASQP